MLKAVGNFVLEQINNFSPLRKTEEAKPEPEKSSPTTRHTKRKRERTAKPATANLPAAKSAEDGTPLERELSLAAWKDGGAGNNRDGAVNKTAGKPAAPTSEDAEERPRQRRRGRPSKSQEAKKKAPEPAAKKPKIAGGRVKKARLSKAAKDTQPGSSGKAKAPQPAKAKTPKASPLEPTAKTEGQSVEGWAAMDRFYRAKLQKVQEGSAGAVITAGGRRSKR